MLLVRENQDGGFGILGFTSSKGIQDVDLDLLESAFSVAIEKFKCTNVYSVKFSMFCPVHGFVFRRVNFNETQRRCCKMLMRGLKSRAELFDQVKYSTVYVKETGGLFVKGDKIKFDQSY